MKEGWFFEFVKCRWGGLFPLQNFKQSPYFQSSTLALAHFLWYLVPPNLTFFGLCRVNWFACHWYPFLLYLLSHLSFLLLFYLHTVTVSPRFFKMEFTFLFLLLLFGGDLEIVKPILHIFCFSNTKHTSSFHTSVPL